jgi:hypothetical protein
MRSRTSALIVVTGGILGTMAIVGGDELPQQAPQKLPAPVVDTHELMELFNEPLYKHLKADIASEPADAKAWNHLKHHGIEAAEIANLIAIRKVENMPKWDAMSRGAQQSGIDLARAAESHDWNKTKSAYEALIKNCNDCHTASGDDHAPQLKL